MYQTCWGHQQNIYNRFDVCCVKSENFPGQNVEDRHHKVTGVKRRRKKTIKGDVYIVETVGVYTEPRWIDKGPRCTSPPFVWNDSD